ncbi:hypothetical protein K3495_g10600 [Podosphaera aphanis]|nr:hypothetical protein K3495_g10600 [Podosphaera aphanis]
MPHSQGVKEVSLLCIPDTPHNNMEEISSTKPSTERHTVVRSDTCFHTALTIDEAESLYHNENLELSEHCYAIDTISQQEKSEYNNLMHRRFGHMGPDQLRNILKVTRLKRPIVVPADKDTCRVCKLTKLRNRTNKTLSPWKESILALISIDVAGPFLPSIRGNTWFCEVIDNSTRRAWTILGKTKSELMLKLEKSKKELATNLKIIAVRSDNAAEIGEKLDEIGQDKV